MFYENEKSFSILSIYYLLRVSLASNVSKV